MYANHLQIKAPLQNCDLDFSPNSLCVGPGNTDASFENGILTVIQKEDMKIKLFGAGFSAENRLKFDNREQEAGTVCEHQIEGLELEFDDGKGLD